MTSIARKTPRIKIPVELIGAARRYCDLIENRASTQGQWLVEIAGLLPRLHAGMSLLIERMQGIALPVQPAPVDLDARFELFSELRLALADRDPYWLEFDTAAEGSSAMTGSLADDLTDIYCELKQGLQLLDKDPEHALALWAFGYEQHWAQHLRDAERHLAMLASQSRLLL